MTKYDNTCGNEWISPERVRAMFKTPLSQMVYITIGELRVNFSEMYPEILGHLTKIMEDKKFLCSAFIKMPKRIRIVTKKCNVLVGHVVVECGIF
jgi:hypothetical protein